MYKKHIYKTEYITFLGFEQRGMMKRIRDFFVLWVFKGIKLGKNNGRKMWDMTKNRRIKC